MKDYRVVLAFRVDADSAEDAATQFVDKITEHGLRKWIYSVMDVETDERVFVSGHGDRINESDLDADPVAEDGTEDAGKDETVDEVVPVAQPTEVENALKLAEQLTSGENPA